MNEQQRQAVQALFLHCGPQVGLQEFERAEGPLVGRRRHWQSGEDLEQRRNGWERSRRPGLTERVQHGFGPILLIPT